MKKQKSVFSRRMLTIAVKYADAEGQMTNDDLKKMTSIIKTNIVQGDCLSKDGLPWKEEENEQLD